MMNQGFGRELIQYSEKIALERSFKEIILWVFKDNMKSRGFYEKMGYAHDGTEKLLERFNAMEIRYSKILR